MMSRQWRQAITRNKETMHGSGMSFVRSDIVIEEQPERYTGGLWKAISSRTAWEGKQYFGSEAVETHLVLYEGINTE